MLGRNDTHRCARCGSSVCRTRTSSLGRRTTSCRRTRSRSRCSSRQLLNTSSQHHRHTSHLASGKTSGDNSVCLHSRNTSNLDIKIQSNLTNSSGSATDLASFGSRGLNTRDSGLVLVVEVRWANSKGLLFMPSLVWVLRM
jgi:hypothetical protein